MNKIRAEYIWMDGHFPTQKLRSKTKVLDTAVKGIEELPLWGFDGSSTNQADGNDSDCMLKPVYKILDPIRGGNNLLVMCEVLNPDGTPHKTNTRAQLVKTADVYKDEEAWFGIEQEYTLFEGRNPLGWPEGGYPAPQGPFYCGVGADEVYGRDIVEEHLDLCLEAGLQISGINAEVMPGQWEYQIGPLGPLEVADQIWLSRWLLYRISEDYGVSATLHPKPVKGDWNGSGMHANFSNQVMRTSGDEKIFNKICEEFGKNISKHIDVYGADNNQRLTGLHETQSIDKFSYGVSDRGASIRIPIGTVEDGWKGRLEDRRPASNGDPYKIASVIVSTTKSAL